MATDGGPRAWAFLRRNPAYRAAYRRVFERREAEPAPFPVRIQSRADREARAWGLLAWEDPDGPDGPVSPFWAEAPMPECEWGAGPPSLAGLVAKAGGRLAGLRLADGALVVKIEKRSGAAQLRILPGSGFGDGAGLVVRVGFGLDEARAKARLEDLGRLVDGPGPGPGADRELLSVLDGRLAGKSWRETAADLYGAEGGGVELAFGRLDARARAAAGQKGPRVDGAGLSRAGGRTLKRQGNQRHRASASQGGTICGAASSSLANRSSFHSDGWRSGYPERYGDAYGQDAPHRTRGNVSVHAAGRGAAWAVAAHSGGLPPDRGGAGVLSVRPPGTVPHRRP